MAFFELVAESLHHVVTKAVPVSTEIDETTYLYTMTGIMIGSVGGHEDGGWHRTNAYVDIPIPGLPGSWQLKLVHWAPFAAPCAIENGGSQNELGWAVDQFRLVNPDRPRTTIGLECDIAFRGSCSILRIAYQITFLGYRV